MRIYSTRYHLTFFFSTCGPGSTTYILPSLLFDEHQLSLFHGICTCMGKFGGALGASLFPQLVSRFGASAFLIPAMLVIILALTCGYKREKGVERGIR